MINSVSYVDGKKYEQRRSQYAEFRAASDKLCCEYGLSVVEEPKAKEPARYARMREAINHACEDASTAKDFHRALYRQGYIFGSDPNRKYATIRARDGGRAVRLYRLGEEYDLAAIDDRLRSNYLLYGPRLYEWKHPPRQYTPKRYRPKDAYAGKGILQIFLEVFFGESQMHRLYLYYTYKGVVKMASIRKRGQNSYLIVVSRGYDYEGNRLKAAQKTVHPPKDLTPGQCKKWLNEQTVLFEREVRHTFVDVSLRGQGVAGQLLRAVADTLRQDGRKARATCSYAIHWFETHPEEQDMLI